MTLARVRIEALNADVSALGFGCASLGSRIAPVAGLTALTRAYDEGVTWFDVAPSYGDGQAEVLLGRFLATRRRDEVQVLTKVGIAPPLPSFKARLMRPAMRMAVAALPKLRTAVRRRRPAATKLRLNAAMIMESLEASLKRLGTDYVDVLALHDATPEETMRDDVLRALETTIASGKTRAIAIASSPEAAAAGIAAGTVYGLAQMGSNVFDHGLSRFRASTPRRVDCVTHSVFGHDGAINRLAARIASDADLSAALAAAGYTGPHASVAVDLLTDIAFADNANGVVLVSMFHERHLRSNLVRHAHISDQAVLGAFALRLEASQS